MKLFRKIGIVLFFTAAMVLAGCNTDVSVDSFSQSELKGALDETTKSSIYEEILSGKTAAELLEKLSTEQKTALFDKMAEDSTFLGRLSQTQIDAIANGASDTKKAEIFDELLLEKTNVEFIKKILNKSGNEAIRKSVKDYLVAELTQEDLQALLNGTTKSSIYEKILSGKTAAELLEKLSTEQKTALFDKMAEDSTFLGRLSQTQIDAIANGASDTKKAEIFDELLLEKTNEKFIKEILNKSGNEKIRKSVKEYLVSELTQKELQSLLDGTDTTAPDDVTNLEALNLGKAVKLTWTDATNDDILAYEITYTAAPSSSRAVSFEANSIVIPQGVGKAVITELKNDTTYTFTIKTVDKIGNKNNGETVSCVVKAVVNAPLLINTTPAVTAITNQDYDISVEVTSNGEIKNIYWEEGKIESTQTFFNSSSKKEITTEKKFTVSKNGDYTVGAIEKDGRREVSVISVSNIDKTAPAKVSDLNAKFDISNKKITLSWTEPTDTDFAKVEITYSKAGGSGTVVEKSKGTTSFELTEIEAPEEEYTFSVASVDNVGNKSVPKTTSITTLKARPAVTSIAVDNAHLSGNQTERTVNVTVKGFNFDKIAEQTDKTFKVQVVTTSGSVTNYDATVNVSENTATAAVTIPADSRATESGTNYTIRAKVCGVPDNDHTAIVNVSSDWEVKSITLDTTQLSVNDVTADSKVHVTVKGTNLDLAKNIKIKLFDSTGTEYTESATSVLTPTELHATTFEADVKIPSTDDFYAVKITASETTSSYKATLQVYGSPEFTSFAIPPAGISKEDNIVTATIKGKNFTAPGITADNFSVSCATSSITSGSSVIIKDDSTLTVTLTIPGRAASYDVTITNGTASKNGIFVVKDYSSVAVGDIIYTDGTTSSKDAELTSGQKPVAVVAGFNTNGAIVGLGLKQSSSTLKWAPKNTTGYKTKFIGIIAYSDKKGEGAGSTATITGDTDGSDNWEYVKSIDPEGTAKAEKNYPAFNFAATYATTAGITGEIAEGWYMPSLAELCELYKNKDTLNTSLSKCSGTQFRDDSYWSSSLTSAYSSYAWLLGFSYASLSSTYYASSYRDIINYVCCVRAF